MYVAIFAKTVKKFVSYVKGVFFSYLIVFDVK